MHTPSAGGSHLDLGRALYVLYGVKYIGLVSLACSLHNVFAMARVLAHGS